MPEEPILLDTSVLLNFLALDRFALLASHPRYRFAITDHVKGEVLGVFPEQGERLDAALEASLLETLRVDSPEELELFSELSTAHRLGLGECSALAAALHRGFLLAIDDRQARNEAKRRGVAVLTTQDLVVRLIREGLLSIEEADEMKHLWQTNHQFRLKIKTFADLFPQ